MATAKAKAKARATTKAGGKRPKASKATAKKATAKKATATKAGAKKAATKKTTSRLTSSSNALPAPVKRALVARGLLNAYLDRPMFQQNDYLWWIGSAKRATTRGKRLQQMLAELEAGNLYMNMPWRPLARR